MSQLARRCRFTVLPGSQTAERVIRSTTLFKTLHAGWADMDFNSHMKNTAYLCKAADVRQSFLAECGFPVEEAFQLRIGPVDAGG